MTSLIFMGVDIESTSSNLAAGGKLCQIGAATLDGEAFCMDVGWKPRRLWRSKRRGYTFEPRALEVNGFTHERIRNGPPPRITDDAFKGWLIRRGAEPRRVVPIGFNVGAFDLPFIRAHLPTSSQYLSRRTIDLNALCFSLWGKEFGGSTPKWSTWKKMAKGYGMERLERSGVPPNEHDAGYDALLAVECWLWLREKMGVLIRDS